MQDFPEDARAAPERAEHPVAENPVLIVIVIALGVAAITFLVVWMLRAAPRTPRDSELSPDERRRRAENPAPPPTSTHFDQGNASGY